MATTKWLLHSRRRWRYECRLLIQPSHTLLISSVVTFFFFFFFFGIHAWVVTLHLHANTFNACMHNKKTKIWFLIRGSHGSIILDEKPANHQSNKAPNKKGEEKLTRSKGPKSWQMKNQSSKDAPRRVDGKGGRKRYKMEGPKSWQMKNPPIGGWVDGEGVEKVQDWRTQVLANEESSKESGSPGEQEQIKYPNLPASFPWWKAYQIWRGGEEHHSSHFYRQVKCPECFWLGRFVPFCSQIPLTDLYRILTDSVCWHQQSQMDEAVNQLQLHQTERPIFSWVCFPKLEQRRSLYL